MITPQERADNLIREINYIVCDDDHAQKVALFFVDTMVDLFVELPKILNNEYDLRYWNEVEHIIKSKGF